LRSFFFAKGDMIMKKTLLVSAILLSSANMAHAGFLDFLFGKKEESAPVVEAPAPATQTSPSTPVAAAATQPSTMESATNLAMGLLPVLTSQLGVSETQAQGGMGSLLQVAQTTLSSNDFAQLSEGIPGMQTLLAAAPALSSKSAGGNALSGMLANAGGLVAGLGSMSKLTQQFEALGLNPEMIVQFATIAIDYFSNSAEKGVENADSTAALLQRGLSAVLGQQ
jgi:hypothetical protein